MAGKKWTNEELEILKNNQDKTIDDIALLLPSRKKENIRSKIVKEGLNYRKKYSIVNGYVECLKCKEEKEYNNSNFDLKDGRLTCRVCRSKISQKAKYKYRHNIYLDGDKGIETYSIYQWYDLFYKKKVKKMPYDISRNNDNIIKIFRYAIKKYLKKSTRDKVITVCTNDIKNLGLWFYVDNLHSVLNSAFPEYNIKPWELQEVPMDFWSNIDNVDNYMMWWVNNNLDTTNMHNISNDVARVFSVSNLRAMSEHKLNRCLHEYEHYNSYYEWLDKLYPEWNLKYEDFNLIIANDGSRLNSRDELIVYEYIKDTLNLNIKPIGLERKNRYFNSEFDEGYFPDFIIETDFDKPIIIEYFGLIGCDQSGIFKGYDEKAKRKTQYFNRKSDVYFIDLYPSDVDNNCQSIKNKLNMVINESDGVE